MILVNIRMKNIYLIYPVLTKHINQRSSWSGQINLFMKANSVWLLTTIKIKTNSTLISLLNWRLLNAAKCHILQTQVDRNSSFNIDKSTCNLLQLYLAGLFLSPANTCTNPDTIVTLVVQMKLLWLHALKKFQTVF